MPSTAAAPFSRCFTIHGSEDDEGCVDTGRGGGEQSVPQVCTPPRRKERCRQGLVEEPAMICRHRSSPVVQGQGARESREVCTWVFTKIHSQVSRQKVRKLHAILGNRFQLDGWAKEQCAAMKLCQFLPRSAQSTRFRRRFSGPRASSLSRSIPLHETFNIVNSLVRGRADMRLREWLPSPRLCRSSSPPKVLGG